MNEVAPVHVGEAAADLDAHVGQQRRREPLPRGAIGGEQRGEIGAAHVVHRDEVIVVDAPEVEHRHQVAVRERHLRLRLLEEHPEEMRALADPREHALDHEQLLEALGSRVARQEHLGHSSLSDRAQKIVAAEPGAQGRHDTVVARARDRFPLAGVCMFFAAELVARAAAPVATVAVYWQPPQVAAVGGAARAAFSDAARSIGARFVDAGAVEPAAPSLVSALEAAKGAYAVFAFRDAIASLEVLQRTADAAGGGDLDGRQLSEIFLYRGLAKLEVISAEAAWDDLVNAARLEPHPRPRPGPLPAARRGHLQAGRHRGRAAAPRGVDPRRPGRRRRSRRRCAIAAGRRGDAGTAPRLGRRRRIRALGGDGSGDGRVHALQAAHPPAPPAAGRPAHRARRAPEPQRLLVGALERFGGRLDLLGPRHHVVRRPLGHRLGHARRRAHARRGRRARQPRPPRDDRPAAHALGAVVIGAAAAVLATTAIALAATRDGSPNVVGELGQWR